MSITEIIPAEIKNDQFYNVIWQVASQVPGKNFLEIGSSSGAGSTEAWAKGIAQNPYRPTLHCLEVSKPRFEVLRETYKSNSQIKCHWTSSVGLSRFPSKEQVSKFYNTVDNNLRQYPLEQVLGWLDQDIRYIQEAAAPTDGIKRILGETQIHYFDAVLIDGSEFLGEAEFGEVYGASVILLDDIRGYKCYNPYQWLKQDASYKLLAENHNLRNGFAVFQRVKF